MTMILKIVMTPTMGSMEYSFEGSHSWHFEAIAASVLYHFGEIVTK